MPASTARQVVVDDEDPRIQYTSGQWQVLPSNKWDDKGNSGPTLFSTLHEGQPNGTFTFNFAGESTLSHWLELELSFKIIRHGYRRLWDNSWHKN